MFRVLVTTSSSSIFEGTRGSGLLGSFGVGDVFRVWGRGLVMWGFYNMMVLVYVILDAVLKRPNP